MMNIFDFMSSESEEEDFMSSESEEESLEPSQGFNGKPALWCGGFMVKKCSDWNPCCGLVNLYAKLGLHRYNLLNKTNLQLKRVERYNYTIPVPAATYYITLSATDPANPSNDLTFQTRVNELAYGQFRLLCNTGSLLFPNPLPEWPRQNPFNRFHLLSETELQSNEWIRLYLELSIATAHKSASKDHDLSNVEILRAAVDEYGLNATVYIHYKDPCNARVGNDVDRVAVVRRTFHDQVASFSLVGHNQSSVGLSL